MGVGDVVVGEDMTSFNLVSHLIHNCVKFNLLMKIYIIIFEFMIYFGPNYYSGIRVNNTKLVGSSVGHKPSRMWARLLNMSPM